MSNDNGNKSGTLTGNATVDILQRKVTLKKELIHLRKLKIQEDKQIQLQNQIEEFDNVTVASRGGLLNYFIKNRLMGLQENIGDF